MKKLLLFILLIPIAASAQLQRYDNFAATTTSASGIGNLTQVIPNATITVFIAPAAGVSCAGGGCVAATTYTSSTGATACGGGLPLTRPTSTTCVANADAQGNFGFWAVIGAYQYCVAATNFTTTCYNASVGQLACKNIGTIRCVDGNNSQGWAGSDFGAWVNSAIANLPVVLPPLNDGTHTYPCGTVYLFPPAGAINTTVSTTIAVNSPCIHLIGTGSGSLNLVCPSSGDCMRVQSNPFNQNPSTELHGFSLTGNGTAASGIHIGDLTHAIISDVAILSFTGSVSDGLGSAGSVGLWIDNVVGFTEQLQINHFWSNNNTIGIKETDSATNCPAVNVSTGYGHWLDVHMNVNANQIGYEIGPGVQSSHSASKFIAMNGNGTGKTFFKMDAVSGSCAAAMTNNNGPYVLVTEDDGPAGGTFMNMASGTTFGAAPCVLHNLNSSPVMTNTLSGTLTCQNFLGPTGNQPYLDSRTFTATSEQLTLSSDASTIDMALQISRNNAGAGVDSQLTTIGNAGDSCSGSTAGDLCIRNNNSGNLITLTSGGTPSLAITNTGIKSTQGLEIFNTTTTCTTAATAGAVCTTAAISLPVAAPDTSYRVTCTGKTPTNTPVVQATTNSSASQFTITIIAVTALASSFGSYDCIAGHN